MFRDRDHHHGPAAATPVDRGLERRRFLRRSAAGLLLGALVSRAHGEENARLEKSKHEWRELLEPARYRVLFEEATERAFTSPLLKEKREGLFLCAACFLPLFDARTKYESGTGWPSFWAAIEGRTATKTDLRIGYPRTEYHCVRCGGHQGHVFADGPPPTGKRWCNNGLALLFVPAGEALPPLRS
jgi:peptide-methionine (R)-S-oxide reductase